MRLKQDIKNYIENIYRNYDNVEITLDLSQIPDDVTLDSQIDESLYMNQIIVAIEQAETQRLAEDIRSKILMDEILNKIEQEHIEQKQQAIEEEARIDREMAEFAQQELESRFASENIELLSFSVELDDYIANDNDDYELGMFIKEHIDNELTVRYAELEKEMSLESKINSQEIDNIEIDENAKDDDFDLEV